MGNSCMDQRVVGIFDRLWVWGLNQLGQCRVRFVVMNRVRDRVMLRVRVRIVARVRVVHQVGSGTMVCVCLCLCSTNMRYRKVNNQL